MAEERALLHSLSLLLDSIRRELPHLIEVQATPHGQGAWMRVGRRASLRLEVRGSVAFPPLLIAEPNCELLNNLPAGVSRPLAAVRRLISVLVETGADLPWEALADDFVNSVANLTLNHLLVWSRKGGRGPEPAWDGHTYYPFPGLRVGPSVDDVDACSNLNTAPVRLPLAISAGLARWEVTDATVVDTRWKAELGEAIALHPWHLARSPVVRELLRDGHLRLLDDTVPATPLASQRTCRLESGRADLKLALDATLTGEHRLLYSLNVANAPAVSALVCRLLREAPAVTLEVQADVASVSHMVPGVGPHLAMIVRAPLDTQGHRLWPATSLWSGPRMAGEVFHLGDGTKIEEFWRAYCRLVIQGPALMWARWGVGLEPHLQNTMVGVSKHLPSRLVLRDLDSALLEERRCRPHLKSLGLKLAPNSWSQMPTLEIAGARLAHALHLGHLATAGGLLVRDFGAEPLLLLKGLRDSWAEIIMMSASSERPRLTQLQALAGQTKMSLHMRLQRSMALRFATSTRDSASIQRMPT